MLLPRHPGIAGLVETDRPAPGALSLPRSGLRLPAAPLRVAAAFGIYLAASLLLGHWQVDDAGITFAYARNLATGHGLVSQPGCQPVEGYSNPAWMLLCAALVKLGLFQPAFSAKLLAAACVLGTLILVDRLLSRTFRLPGRATLAGLAILGANASFIIWCNSGLENSLYALFSAACLAAICVPSDTSSRHPTLTLGASLAFGVCSAGLALTRPDGLIYFGVLPVAAALTLGLRAAVRATCMAAIPYAALVGGYLACRLAVFHAWLPNTALMKGSGSLASLVDAVLLRKAGLLKLVDASSSLCPLDSGWVLIALVALGYCGRHVFRASRPARAVGVFALFALTAFVLLPADWMPHQRFATPLVVALSVLLPVLWCGMADARAVRRPTVPSPVVPPQEGRELRRRPAAAWGACAVVLLAGVNVLHVWDFSRAHVVAFDEILRQSDQLNAVAASLELDGSSVLAADVGGMLWNSRLRVYDLLGLTDRTVAATFNRDKAALYEYIFGRVQPTFIKVHRKLLDLAQLERDPRLARDYVLLRGDPTAAASDDEAGHLLYVRKEAVAGKKKLLERVRK